jgi:adenine phosphoribosyltransferase
MDYKKLIREVPDFPKQGIVFKDITTLLKNQEGYKTVIDEIYNKFKDKKITKVVCLESRGFIMGGALAYKLNAGFIPIRKKGKLPSNVYSETYELEYGEDTIEIHKDSLNSQDVVLIHDDLLATGGTVNAAIKLIEKSNVKNIMISFLCDLTFINNSIKEKVLSYPHQILIEY